MDFGRCIEFQIVKWIWDKSLTPTKQLCSSRHEAFGIFLLFLYNILSSEYICLLPDHHSLGESMIDWKLCWLKIIAYFIQWAECCIIFPAIVIFSKYYTSLEYCWILFASTSILFTLTCKQDTSNWWYWLTQCHQLRMAHISCLPNVSNIGSK